MKIQLFFTLAFLMLCSATLLAQNYDLNSYDFRYQKNRGLSLDFDLGNSGNQNFNSKQDTFFADSSFQNEGRSSSSFNFNPSYFSFVNTDALQRSVNANLGSDFSIDLVNEKSTYFARVNERTTDVDLDLNYSNTSRFYKGDKFRYLRISTSSSFDTDGTQRKRSDEQDSDFKSYSFNNRTSFSYGIGAGRTNDVRDAVQAMFIIQDLKKVSGVSFTNEQLEGIAQGITQIRNARYLDFRIGYKMQIKMLDSVLRENGISGENSIDYFTTISDNWLYANRAFRTTGRRWTHYLSVGNQYGFSKTNLKYPVGISPRNYYDQSAYVAPEASLNTDYIYSTQKSLYVQNSYGFSVSSGLLYENSRHVVLDSEFPIDQDTFNRVSAQENVVWNTTLRGSYAYLYQANTRNLFRVLVNPSISYSRWLPEYSANQFAKNNSTLAPDLRVTSDYYHWFSPHLNLRASGIVGSNFRFTQQEDEFIFYKEQNTGLYYTLTLGLNYQLF